MESVNVYKMTLKDIQEVFEIEELSFSTPWSYQSFINEIKDNKCAKYIVAKIKGRVVGYGGLWIIVDEGHITNIAVHPDFRGMGIGSMLVLELINIGVKNKLLAITLEARKSNSRAIHLYKKYGFEIAGIRPKYYGDNGEDAVIMWNKNIYKNFSD